MIVVKTVAQILTPFHDETICMKARTVNGVAMPERTWKKRYYFGMIEGEPCMLRAREEVDIPTDLKAGTKVMVGFSKLEVESDVSQVWLASIEVIKG